MHVDPGAFMAILCIETLKDGFARKLSFRRRRVGASCSRNAVGHLGSRRAEKYVDDKRKSSYLD